MGNRISDDKYTLETSVPDDFVAFGYRSSASAPKSRRVNMGPAQIASAVGLKSIVSLGADPTGVALSDAAFAAAADSGEVYDLGSGAYKISAAIDMTSGAGFVSSLGASVEQTTAGARCVYGVGVDGCVIRGIEWIGANTSSNLGGSADGGLVEFTKNGSTMSSNIRIENNTVRKCKSGIVAIYVDDLHVLNNEVYDYLKYGICTSQSTPQIVALNHTHDCVATGAVNAYGITATGDSDGGRPMKDVTIVLNTIEDVPAWDGIMTHDAESMTIAYNTIRDVRTGVDISSSSADNVIRDIQVRGNEITLTSDNEWGSTAAIHAGVWCSGYSGARATGIEITDNRIKNWVGGIPIAYVAGSIPAAISCEQVADARIAGNRIECVGGSYAISVYSPGDDIIVEGNRANGSIYLLRLQNESAATQNRAIVSSNIHNTTDAAKALVMLHTGTFNGFYQGGNISNATNLEQNVSATINRSDAPLALKGRTAANEVHRLEPYSNSYKSKLLLSSALSGDGGMEYDSNNNRLEIFGYTSLRFWLTAISGSLGTQAGEIGASGLDMFGDLMRLRTAKTPASASATGSAGQFCWDASYFYICTATNTWRRIAHATW